MNLRQKALVSGLTGTGNVLRVVTRSTRVSVAAPRPAEKVTAGQLFDRYERSVSPSHATTSARREGMAFRALTRLLGELPAVDLTPDKAYEYRTRRGTDGVAAGTVDYELRLLQQVFRCASTLWGHRDLPVPCVRGVRPRVDTQHGVGLSECDLARVLSTAELDLRAVVAFAVATGLRISELVALEWPQINLATGTMMLMHQKNKQQSLLPLSEAALAAIAVGAASGVTGTGVVFRQQNGQAWTDRALRQRFKATVKEAGVQPCRFHDLRHTFATRLLQAGVPIYAVQKLGRWSSATMMSRYGHYDTEGLRSMLAKVG